MGKPRKRNTLRLTSRQKDDLQFIKEQIQHYININRFHHVVANHAKPGQNVRFYSRGEKHYACKTHLEYMLHETDIKKEKECIMESLLRMEHLISLGESDDFGRYTKMALQIQAENSFFNFRKEMIYSSNMRHEIFSTIRFSDCRNLRSFIIYVEVVHAIWKLFKKIFHQLTGILVL